ncbi:MAG: helix-turn-helix domain-containing protein [Verrucomicrobiota bacterium]|nr:helix-turn-helix domain-containing protein [Verrucomicrobiota bacterium]
MHASVSRPRLVGILGFDGVATLDFVEPLEAFKAARIFDNGFGARACYEVITLGLGARSFTSESGLVFKVDKQIDEIRSIDTLLIPGGTGAQVMELRQRMATWLHHKHERIRRIVAVSAGIYPLAQSGLLDGVQVTTHWRYARDVVQTFPKLRINSMASFSRDGRFFTCGGGKAALEMTLNLIDEDYGAQVSREVAREFVVRLKPSGANDSLVYLPQEQNAATDRLADLPAWILAHLDQDLSVTVLAQKTALCPRHFRRLFRRVFNTAPAEFVEQLRLGEARRRLLGPRTTIKSVADSVGFRSADAFRRAFERRLGMTPSKFRLRSQGRLETKLRKGALIRRRSLKRGERAIQNVEQKIRVSTR